MDLQSKDNAKKALNELKMEICSESEYYNNIKTDKINVLNEQPTLEKIHIY